MGTISNIEQEFAGFIQVLRHLGLKIGTSETIDALKAVSLVGMLDRKRLRAALRATLVKDRDSYQIFMRAFEAYFVDPETRKQHLLEQLNQAKQDQELLAQVREELSEENLGMQLDLSEEQARTYAKLSEEDKQKLLKFLASRSEGNDVVSPDKLLETVVKQQINYWKRQMELEAELDRQPEHAYTPIGDEELDALLDHIAKTYQADDRFMEKDFKRIQEEELDSFAQVLHRLTRKWVTRISRRYKMSKRKQLLDVRKTVRKNIGFGGALFALKYKSKRVTKPRLLMLCDMSGSMTTYAQFVLMFVYGLASVVKDIDSVIFAEHALEVSHLLRQKLGFRETMAAILNQGQGVGQGTNLGRCLEEVLVQGKINSDTTVILLSDGKTVGEGRSAKLLHELSQLSKRVIWLNPVAKATWKEIALCQLVDATKVTSYECNTLKHLDTMLSKEARRFY